MAAMYDPHKTKMLFTYGKLKCADLNRYTFSLLHIEEKVYLFKSAHFTSSHCFHEDQIITSNIYTNTNLVMLRLPACLMTSSNLEQLNPGKSTFITFINSSKFLLFSILSAISSSKHTATLIKGSSFQLFEATELTKAQRDHKMINSAQ